MTDLSAATTALLRAHAVRWVGAECYPWVIEVAFEDTDGKRHSLIDKVPLFAFGDEPGPDLVFPVPVFLDCTILDSGQSDDRLRVAVDHRSVNEDGYAEFTVVANVVSSMPQ